MMNRLSTFIKLTIFAGLLCVCSSIQAQSGIQAWSKVAKPTRGHIVESIGSYTSGCIRGAAALPQNGTGYQVMRLSRNRYFGHPDLVQFIRNLGKHAQNQHLGTLLIGDMGQARGGPTLTGHRSHQTGLDVDIWYLLDKEAEKRPLSFSEREQWNAPSVLTVSSNGVNPAQWTSANEKVLEAAALMPEVDRIFVNAQIKKTLCERKTAHDWLQKIRPWFAHADHFHVRLKCPSASHSCDKQEPVPAGDGCGADLAWWFTEDAKKPSKKTPSKPPVLPEQCTTVLNEKL
ncbi:MAG: penicillin-insensitive murein endopeptidase [Methyloglobulus sp.]